MNKTQITGMIFNIQRDSTEDGPGIRTTVFMKGCPMSCPWCHNPEGMKYTPELVWYDTRCIGDGACIKACPNEALSLTANGIVIDRVRCRACGDCVKACPAAALEVLGRKQTVEEVVSLALRDRVFFEKSGGGVTLSGGEPSMQVDFTLTIMRELKKENIHVALDTCGGVPWEKLQPLVELADLVLFDIKVMDRARHELYTGIPLELVLKNALNVSSTGTPMWVRTPVIPGHTDLVDNIQQVARFIKHQLPAVERYDILAFNNSCSVKYRRLDRQWLFEEEALLTDQAMEKLAGAAKEEGLPFVHWSGMTRLEASETPEQRTNVCINEQGSDQR